MKFKVVLACSLAIAGASVAHADSVKVGAPIVLSGSSAVVGQTGLHGLQMAIEDINAAGGLLGKTVELVVADDAGNPATANTVTRDMILNNEVVAMFPGSNSASGSAEQVLAGQYKVPAFFFSATDISLTTTNFNKYTFQMSPSTYMDPRAWATYVKGLGAKHVYIINPDINYGRSYADNFKKGLADNGSGAEIVGEQYPAVGTSDFSSYISAAIAAKPDFLYLGLLPGDQVSFLRQAKGYGLFDITKIGAPNAVDVVSTMREEAPKGLNVRGVTPLFFEGGDPEIQKFTERYQKLYGKWPTEWPVVAYAAVQAWAEAVKKANSFESDAIATALSGQSVKTLRGEVEFRECDHQGMVPVYIGQVADKVDPTYGFPLLVNFQKIEAKDMAMPCDEAVALQKKK